MRLIDRYILRETLKPLALSLTVVLTALVLERVLRLFDLLADQGSPIGLVLRMAVNLIPHYLGLALPAAFFISVTVVMTRLGGDSELDVMRSSGLSVRRLSLPFLGLGMALTLFGLALFGFLQPYSRYAYRAVVHAATDAAWDARVAPTGFVETDGMVITADRADQSGRRLTGVFVFEPAGEGSRVTTAAEGVLSLTADGERMVVTLRDGVQLHDPGTTAPPERLVFEELTLDRAFEATESPFRARGAGERELTFTELWRQHRTPAAGVEPARIDAELNARLARGMSLLVLPLLAVPLGLAAKRSRRVHGIVLAALILLLYHHTLQLGESLADTGRLPPMLGIWAPFAAFCAVSLWTFARVDVRPGRNPFQRPLDALEAGGRFFGQLRPVRRGVSRGEARQ